MRRPTALNAGQRIPDVHLGDVAAVVSGRTPSSSDTVIGSPLRYGTLSRRAYLQVGRTAAGSEPPALRRCYSRSQTSLTSVDFGISPT